MEEKHLVGSAESLVGEIPDAGVAARRVALFGREDGKFLVGGDQGLGEDLGRRRAAVTLGVEVREGVAPGTIL